MYRMQCIGVLIGYHDCVCDYMYSISNCALQGTWSNYAFAIIYNNEDYLGFLAEDETTVRLGAYYLSQQPPIDQLHATEVWPVHVH